MTKEQEMFYLHELSTGTKDQLMMAVRFVSTSGQLLMDLLTELSEQQLPSLLQYASSYFAL